MKYNLPAPMPRPYRYSVIFNTELCRSSYLFTMSSLLMDNPNTRNDNTASTVKIPTAEAPAPVTLLHKSSISKYYTLILGLGVSNVHYRPGDHIGLFPENKPCDVERALSLFELDKIADSVVLIFRSLSENPIIKGTPRDLFTSYFDLSAIACIRSVRIFSQLVSSDEEKNFLEELSSSKVRCSLSLGSIFGPHSS